jgi:hypothetical protein
LGDALRCAAEVVDGVSARGGAAEDLAGRAGTVVDALDDVRGTVTVTGACGAALRSAAGDRAVEVGNANLPIASPAPKTIRAANAIAVAVPAVRRRAIGPAA